MKKKILAVVLTVTMLIVSILPAYATGAEQFISDVALVYEDSVEDAKKAIEGTDWILFEHDLNENADVMFDDGVYLVFKTTTNVEEAITDLRVMDMYGGYSSTNYQTQLQQSKNQYMQTVALLSVVIKEYKALYEAGDEMAKLAFRQLNFYKDIGESDLTMGNYFLMDPTETALVTLLMEGNPVIVSNIIALLAIGISGTNNTTLATRISELYGKKDTLTDELYYDAASTLVPQFEEIETKLERYDALKDEHDLTSEELSEEDVQFMTQIATLAVMLEEITLGDTNLAALLRTGEWAVSDLYPVVAAMSEAQIALVALGQLEVVLKYSAASRSLEELNTAVDEIEKNLTAEDGTIEYVDVYFGIDRSVFEGEFSMTTGALRYQAQTGNTWHPETERTDFGNFLYNAALIVSLVDFVLWCGVVMSAVASSTIEGYAVAMGSTYLAKYTTYAAASAALKSGMGSHLVPIFTGGFSTSLLATAGGMLLISAGLIAASKIYNYYNVNYLVIPDAMVDIREGDLGDHYIKYTAAKVVDGEGRNADFNAYQGKEWIALYYTKDAHAGNCLTPNVVIKQDNATVSRRHQGISMFGESDAYNLNSHVFNDEAPSTYLSVRYSATKKAAVEDVPSVVGSMFGWGGIAISAGLGVALGMGIMALANNKKKKSAEA